MLSPVLLARITVVTLRTSYSYSSVTRSLARSMASSSIFYVIILLVVFASSLSKNLPMIIRVIGKSDDEPRDEESGSTRFRRGAGGGAAYPCLSDDNCTLSFTDALDHLTNNTLLNVTSHVELSSVKQLEYLQYVTIVGHNNPTVNCSRGGALHFSSCRNCTIQGITWKGCGIANRRRIEPAILFHNSSNILIQHCAFQHSKGPTVALSEVSGVVNVSHCKFASNLNKGHGAAIYYTVTSSDTETAPTISDCKFTRNIGMSILYVGQSTNIQSTILIKNSLFGGNKGVSIFVSKHNLRIGGTVKFEGNKVSKGCGIFATDHANVTFDENSRVLFITNKATNGGAIHIGNHSSMCFDYNSVVTFDVNHAKNGGVVNLESNSRILFDRNCTVHFVNNTATNVGGAIESLYSSIIVFKSFAKVLFDSNSASIGGAIFSNIGSSIVFEGNATVTFNSNRARENGGALVIHVNSTLTFKGNTVVTFTNNEAVSGGGAAVRSTKNCTITFGGNSIVTFANNSAYSGGAIHSESLAKLTVDENSKVMLDTNRATNGGCLYFHTFSTVNFKGNSSILFINNTAVSTGGAVYSYYNSNITITESPNVTFIQNIAKTGGAIHATTSDVKFSGKTSLTFKNNQAVHEGGAIYLSDQSNILFDKDVSVTFASNGATYGAGMYSNLSESTATFNSAEVHNYNNTAGVAGRLVYAHIPSTCNKSCLDEKIMGFTDFVTTPPKMIVLNEPAISICNDTDTATKQCNRYYVNNIMLGQEMVINSCLIDHYDKPSDEVVEFLISGKNAELTPSLKYIAVSRCSDTPISITGNQRSLVNYTITISTFMLHIEERKQISIDLIVGLSSCHSGFLYNEISQNCECFDTNNDVVFCSASTSMIQRGYWFGEVDGKTTTTVCPMSYCDFTSCNTASEFCPLFPERINQCNSHRSGTACGDCEKGYTLPFYSTECINRDKCATVWTTVVILLTVVYWIVLVIVVFITMYYKVSIGYLYAITYYYSIVDVLLSEYLYISDGLYITINIMYSIVKLTPQFLGKLCLLEGMSGIDQQFIHYIHPLAISLMLIIIVVLARFSRRLSAVISRGIIRVICFLLLLSYTSVTITSLLLLRHLQFYNVDKIYTYLSPDIEYFQGRHIAYGIIAFLCIIFIVIGLPLLLIVEPFINSKINFVRIKPLLDQFQGCYKDKYRWFAGYYMVCRITIITITIIFSSNDFTSRYLLITTCAAILLIHLSIRPYSSKILNAFDGILLLLLVLVAILLLVEFIDFDSVVPIIFVLLVLPLTVFSLLCLFIHKDSFKNAFTYVYSHRKTCERDDVNNNSNDSPVKNDTATSPGEYDLTIDDRMRTNATVCDM